MITPTPAASKVEDQEDTNTLVKENSEESKIAVDK